MSTNKNLINKGTFNIYLLIALLILAFSIGLGTGIEYRPGEREAEYLFDLGIGEPWVGGAIHPGPRRATSL